MTAEKVVREGNMRQLYDTTKKLAGNYRKPERPVKSKEGKVITSIEEQQNRHYQQQPTVGENKADLSRGRNQEEALEVDRTHIEESTQLRHKVSPHLDSSRSKEEGKIKEHITPGNEDRHEMNEQELDGARNEGPGQSVLENDGRRPILLYED
ncbi:unnamed protein product [Schistosoma curassoni]|uniref:Uncharacterized protein n=1 Tax=Schistosoma curassoni TaxID=6186 RepID=A0A183K2V5_9TREM|nr:unnamed protein product [Schistosoma curassoni]